VTSFFYILDCPFVWGIHANQCHENIE
jgi:hypothetical protein